MRHIPGSITIAAATLVTVSSLAAQQSADTKLEVLQLRPNFYMIAGAGGNVGFQVGVDGVVVVDTGSASSADAVVAAIQKVTTHPIRYVINTSADPDHVGGNAAVAKAGRTLFTQNADFLGGGASILSVEQVLTRMSGPSAQASPFPAGAWPSETFNQPRKFMYLNGEGIEILHQPAAHTDGDAMVFFRRSDVVRICDQLDVVEYRDMVTIIRDRIRDLMNQGLTLEQVKAASPARGYTRRYGSENGSWTTNNFVEAVYRSMSERNIGGKTK
jgi:glyoxylase-like metal-dependent hydrolase (beta-lactamase superfamily II)